MNYIYESSMFFIENEYMLMNFTFQETL